MYPPVKQNLRKFKPDMSLKIKEEVTKQIKVKVLRVVEYPTWLANIVSVSNKDGKFPDEEVSFVGEDITETYDGWRMFFHGAANFKGVGIGVVLVSETGQHYPLSAKLKFPCTNIMAKYEACILGLKLAIDMNVQELLVIGDLDLLLHQVLGEWATKNTKILPYLYYVQELMKRFTKIEFKHVPRIQNEFADALVTLYSMIQHPDKNFIDPIPVGIHNQPTYCAHVEEETEMEICGFMTSKNTWIKHKNSTAYRSQMNGAVEATNKTNKKILRMMIDNYKQWHEKLSFALLGYHTTAQ
ncbi:uncharacterized protein [Nicotiana tomentosiformis]|uniref:uncharacterized protein n=1 Tax=Nicotiana tomentosiformis TaxID=4098 RepID=UPI00388CE36C